MTTARRATSRHGDAMNIVTPERWYIGFWIVMGFGFLAALYFVIRMGVADGMNDALKAARSWQ